MSATGGAWTDGLRELEAQGLRRRLRTIDSPQDAYILLDGQRLCCLCSNNYLGLANHPRIVRAVREAVDRWGWGSGASQLVSGHMTPHTQLEARLAQFKRTEAALVCPSGYAANLAAIRAICGEGDLIASDRLNHASIIDAARTSGATFRVFPHRDYDRLAALLDRSTGYRRRIILTDSLFSMDGDLADLSRLVEIKRRYDALLCIDEAHATGVFGAGGRGAAEAYDVDAEVDVVVGTLSKALGGIGGFIAARRELIDWIINTGGPFIYTTALPPAACAAAVAALDVVESDEGLERRTRVLEHAAWLREQLAQRGFELCGSTSQIIPVMVGEADAAVRFSEALQRAGFLIPCIRPPTVPRGTARLRISITAEHTREDLERLVSQLERCRNT